MTERLGVIKRPILERIEIEELKRIHHVLAKRISALASLTLEEEPDSVERRRLEQRTKMLSSRHHSIGVAQIRGMFNH